MDPGAVAVIAHSSKTLGGGLPELRHLLADRGVERPQWFEIAKSKQAPDCARQALDAGAQLLVVWGGDGTVQRCIDAVAGEEVPIAIIPAGTANLLATNLGIPHDIAGAIDAALSGARRRLDTGTVNGEHFAVMAGAGFDALMIGRADAGLKDRFGRLAYIWTGARSMNANPVNGRLEVDGRSFFTGPIACVLTGNMGRILGGIEVFPGSDPGDGLLEVGIVTARSWWQWLRTLVRVAVGRAERSPFVITARGASFRVTFDSAVPLELDGGERKPVKKLRIEVCPASVDVCVPGSTNSGHHEEVAHG